MKRSYQQARRRAAEGVTYKHDLGQHFLYDEALLRSLVEATGVGPMDGVLDIGPGAGTLTRCLCEAAGRVAAVEVDRDVLPFLRAATDTFDNLSITEGDVRRLDLAEVCRPLGEGFFVIANIPYNITTPVLTKLVETPCFESITVMIQKEVAQRLCAAQGSADGGAFSLFLQYYMETELLFDVPREKFLPAPKVTSAVIRCVRRSRPAVEVEDADFFFRCVRAAFVLRRKTLANSLAAGLKGFDKAAIQSAIEAGGWSPSVRGEQLTLSDFARLAQLLRSAQA